MMSRLVREVYAWAKVLLGRRLSPEHDPESSADASAAESAANLRAENGRQQMLIFLMQGRPDFREFMQEALLGLEQLQGLLVAQRWQEASIRLGGIRAGLQFYDVAYPIGVTEPMSAAAAAPLLQLHEELSACVRLAAALREERVREAALGELAYKVHPSQCAQLEQNLRASQLTPKHVQMISCWLRELRTVSAYEMLGPLETHVARVAQTLGKKVRLTLEGGELRLDSRRLQAPLKMVVHLLINAIDHGIEMPAARGEKSVEGQLLLRLALDDLLQLTISVEDDGCGLDLRRIGERAKEVGLVSSDALATMTAPQLQQLILKPRMSSPTFTSPFAGLGGDLALINRLVKDLGGYIEISSEPQRGTRILLVIPTEETVEMLAAIA